MGLDEASQKLCVIVLPWGLYQYLVLPMGSAPLADIFQSAMSKLFHDMESVIAYMDDLMCLEATSFEAHIKKLDEILTRLEDMGLQINPKKAAWLK